MKNLARTVAVAVVCLGALTAGAQPVTNLVQNVTLGLTLYASGDSTTNGVLITTPVIKQKRSTKDIIQLIGLASTNTFSSRAKLVLVTPLPDGDSIIMIQDGTNAVNVSGFFTVNTEGDAVVGGTFNTLTGTRKTTAYDILEFSLHDNGSQELAAAFDARGLITIKSASIVKGGAVIGDNESVSASLAGTGEVEDDDGDHAFIVQMTLSVTGGTLVVVP